MAPASSTLASRRPGRSRRALLRHPDGREGDGALYLDIPTAGKASARSTLTSRRPGRRRRALLGHPDGREGVGALYFGIPTAGKAPASYTSASRRPGRRRRPILRCPLAGEGIGKSRRTEKLRISDAIPAPLLPSFSSRPRARATTRPAFPRQSVAAPRPTFGASRTHPLASCDGRGPIHHPAASSAGASARPAQRNYPAAESAGRTALHALALPRARPH